LPPLYKRSDDIPLLVNHFIEEFGHTNRNISGADAACVRALKSHSWPGNLRELRHVIQGALVISRGPLLLVMDLPAELKPLGEEDLGFGVRPRTPLRDVERKLIYRTIRFTGGNKTRAAELLGISLRALYYRLQRYKDGEWLRFDLR
jgi:two-component system response regulator HydG